MEHRLISEKRFRKSMPDGVYPTSSPVIFFIKKGSKIPNDTENIEANIDGFIWLDEYDNAFSVYKSMEDADRDLTGYSLSIASMNKEYGPLGDEY